MALVITNLKTEQTVLDLAQATGESVDDAVAKAAEARLKLLAPNDETKCQTGRKYVDMERVYALLREFDALPRLDHRTPDEILGYDEHGLPT